MNRIKSGNSNVSEMADEKKCSAEMLLGEGAVNEKE